MVLAIPIAYTFAGVILLALIGLIIYSLRKGTGNELRLDDLEDDDFLYDPETGAKLSFDDAMEDKAFVDPSTERTDSVYDEEEAVRVTYGNLPHDLKEKAPENIVEAIIRIQGQYILQKPGKTGAEDNIDFIVKILHKAGIVTLEKSTVKGVLEAEKIYSESLKKSK